MTLETGLSLAAAAPVLFLVPLLAVVLRDLRGASRAPRRRAARPRADARPRRTLAPLDR